MKYSPKKAYLNLYIPSHILDEFRAHCMKNGLTLSSTVCSLIEKYLQEKKESG